MIIIIIIARFVVEEVATRTIIVTIVMTIIIIVTIKNHRFHVVPCTYSTTIFKLYVYLARARNQAQPSPAKK